MKKLIVAIVLCVSAPVQAGVICNGVGCVLEKTITKTVEVKKRIVGHWGSATLIGPAFGCYGMQRRQMRRADRFSRRSARLASYGSCGK